MTYFVNLVNWGPGVFTKVCWIFQSWAYSSKDICLRYPERRCVKRFAPRCTCGMGTWLSQQFVSLLIALGRGEGQLRARPFGKDSVLTQKKTLFLRKKRNPAWQGCQLLLASELLGLSPLATVQGKERPGCKTACVLILSFWDRCPCTGEYLSGTLLPLLISIPFPRRMCRDIH